MRRAKTRKAGEIKKTTMQEGLSEMHHSAKTFKLQPREKSAFRKAKSAEEQSKKAGFTLGGSLK